MPKQPDVITLRRRAVKGFSFRNHSAEQLRAISYFIKTGEMTKNFPESYKKMWDLVKDDAS